MKLKLISAVLTGLLSIFLVTPNMAAEKQSLQEEIIYDLLVDRYFNKVIQNDSKVNSVDPTAFNGGDFAGLSSEMQYIKDMGFTALSVGSIFSSATYDGKEVLDYEQLEPSFGTEEEWQEVIAKAHELDMKIIIDLPTQKISKNHLWRASNPEWFTENEDGTVALNTSIREVQDQLIERFSSFVTEFEVDGIRLQTADKLDPAFIERFSKSMKDLRDMYILSDVAMDSVSGMDAVMMPGIEEALRNSYKNFDPDSKVPSDYWEQAKGNLTQVDSLLSSRFTSDVIEERGFPPTRWNLLMFQLLTMPGTPVVQYGSEIAVNGAAAPDSHPILDMGVGEELIDHITNLTSLRNESEALRTGEMEILYDKEGWLVYKRSDEKDTWIIAINNSSSTKTFAIPANVIGSGKEMRGLFENDIIRENDEGNYQITLDREVGEAFTIIEQRGLNKAYIAALIVLYFTFMIFLWFAWRKGKKRSTNGKRKL
ncbi:alpha-amylase family glycosyl hydrolase [Planococcus beigongshangi]|uniref:alpha-amylase family glycosyl hydrolase n=1 Tax=Planococcus beigongshangi TaxID=2782536 RepID=UPI00193B3F58